MVGALRRVMVLTNANGRSNGQAFVEFPSPQDAETAMIMDRQMFGNRYVEVRPCCFAEHHAPFETSLSTKALEDVWKPVCCLTFGSPLEVCFGL